MNSHPKLTAKARIMWCQPDDWPPSKENGTVLFGDTPCKTLGRLDEPFIVMKHPKGFTKSKLRAIERLVNMSNAEIEITALMHGGQNDTGFQEAIRIALRALGLIAKKGKKGKK